MLIYFSTEFCFENVSFKNVHVNFVIEIVFKLYLNLNKFNLIKINFIYNKK